MKKQLFSIFSVAILFAVSSVTSAQGELVFSDDFSGSAISGGHRLFFNNADANWQGSFDTAWGDPTLWGISSGSLTNAGTGSADFDGERAREKVAAYLTTVSSTDTSLKFVRFSFDYSVGTGSTLYFHAMGLDSLSGTPPYSVNNPHLFNLHAVNGNVGHGAHLDANFSHINLFDGSNFTGSAGSALSFTGTGTFTGIYDMSSYSIAPGSLEYIAAGFGNNMSNNDGSGAISIDNFSIQLLATPEPTTVAMFGLAITGLATRRRR